MITKSRAFLIALFLIFLCQWHNARAADPFMNTDAQGSDGKPPQFQGESVDLRTGMLGFELPIVSIPGSNGMDINVAVSFNKSTTAALELGQFWTIEVPRLISNDGGGTLCYAHLIGPTLVLPGQAPEVFIRTLNNTWVPGNPIPTADYITTSGWSAYCAQGPNDTSLATAGDFVVRSPSGVIYNFIRQPAIAGTFNPTAAGAPATYPPNESNPMYMVRGLGDVLLLNSMVDLYGNTINYTYNFGGLVSKMKRNDGEEVDFSYISTSVAVSAGTYPFQALSSITANSKTWKFAYTGCYDEFYGIAPATSCEQPLLHSITRPDGKQWLFQYVSWGHQIDTTWAVGRTVELSQVTAPNGLIANYQYQPRASYAFEYAPTHVGPMLNYFQLTLIQKSYSGPGISSPIIYNYQYYIGNFVDLYLVCSLAAALNSTCPSPAWQPQQQMSAGDPFSYTFELGPSKMKVFKYSRSTQTYSASTTAPVAQNPKMDNALLIESAVLPLPPAGTIAAVAPPPPPPGPSVVITNLAASYTTQPIAINFTIADPLPITSVTCALDNNPLLPCTSFSSTGGSFTLPSILNPGQAYSVTVQVTDSMGLTATAVSPSFSLLLAITSTCPATTIGLCHLNAGSNSTTATTGTCATSGACSYICINGGWEYQTDTCAQASCNLTDAASGFSLYPPYETIPNANSSAITRTLSSNLASGMTITNFTTTNTNGVITSSSGIVGKTGSGGLFSWPPCPSSCLSSSATSPATLTSYYTLTDSTGTLVCTTPSVVLNVTLPSSITTPASTYCAGTTISYCALPASTNGSTATGVCPTGGTGTCSYICNSGTYTSVNNTCQRQPTIFGDTWTDLAARNSGCSSATPNSGACISAVNRYCQSAGFVSGYEIGARNSTTNYFTCVGSNAATFIQSTFTTLATYISTCNSATVAGSGNCNAAIHRYCAANGYVAGFGPVEYSGNTAYFVCMNSTYSTIINTTFTALQTAADISAGVPIGSGDGCSVTSGVPIPIGCYEAINAFCIANGYAGRGFGPIEYNTTVADVTCVQ